MTKQKKIILDIIMNSRSHPTAEDIYREAKNEMPGIALGTVYRNLGIMAEKGEIRRISGQNMPDRYDKVFPAHEHMQCTECGRISDVMLKPLEGFIEKEVGCHISGYDLMIKYVCTECSNK